MNSISIVGNLVKDVETRTNQQGQMFCIFSVAENSSKGEVIYYSCISSNVSEYIQKGKKGQKVFVSGKFSRKENFNNVTVYSMLILSKFEETQQMQVQQMQPQQMPGQHYQQGGFDEWNM